MGEPRVQGPFTIQEQRRSGEAVWRVSHQNGLNLVLSVGDLFDLAELLDDTCDQAEDRGL